MSTPCRKCRRPALFRSKGKKANARLHSDKQHDLCQRCHRDQVNAARARAAAPRTRLIGPFPHLEALVRAHESAAKE